MVNKWVKNGWALGGWALGGWAPEAYDVMMPLPPNYEQALQFVHTDDKVTLLDGKYVSEDKLPDRQLRTPREGGSLISDGYTTVIDTGIFPSDDIEFTKIGRLVSVTDNYGGTGTLADPSNRFSIGINNDSGKFTFGFVANTVDTTVDFDFLVHSFTIKNKQLWIDGVLTSTATGSFSSPTETICLGRKTPVRRINFDYHYVEIKKGGVRVFEYNFEDGSGTTVRDSSGTALVPNGNHGTIVGNVDWQTSVEIQSQFNLIGGNIVGGVTIPTLDTPENLALPIPNDVLGNPCEFYKRCKYSVEVLGDVITTDGTNTLSFADLSGLTVVSSIGTSTPTVSGNIITLTAGTLSRMELSNGEVFTFSTVNGTKVYSQNLVGTVTGNTTSIWAKASGVYPYNYTDGCDKWVGAGDPIYMPIGITCTETGYTFDSTLLSGLNEPTVSKQLPSNDIWEADQLFDVPLFFTLGVANEVPYASVPADYEFKHIWLNDLYTVAPNKKNWVLYYQAQIGLLTGEDAHNALDFVNALETVLDSEGVLVTYVDGTPMTVLKEGVK